MEDMELFQWVLLGLLALGIIVLIALLATLGGIKKALERRSTDAAPSPAGHDDTTGHEPALAQEAETSQPEPVTTGTYPPSETAAATPATTTTGQASTIRSVLAQHGMSDTAEQPAATQQPAAQPEETEGVDSAFAAHADDPQEEPFQRDGRWWFKRGDELLLYDEASGQWQPAPGETTSAEATPAEAAAAPAATTAPEQQSGAVQTTQVTEAPAVADQVSTFWKCPTCGAVNGSTAASCRMCFAARP